MQVILGAVVFATMLASAAPTPAPVQPAPAAAESPLPEIGRVRSTPTACAAIRDLVAPSFDAVRRADARFALTRERLPRYAEIVSDPWNRGGVLRKMAIAQLDQDASAMLKEALVLNRALGDPRLASSRDPLVVKEREELTQLYETQEARASLLAQFVMRERVAIAKGGTPLSPQSFGMQQNDDPPTPAPGATAAPNMPRFTGIDVADKAMVDRWAAEISAPIAASETQAARAMLPIAKGCLAR